MVPKGSRHPGSRSLARSTRASRRCAPDTWPRTSRISPRRRAPARTGRVFRCPPRREPRARHPPSSPGRSSGSSGRRVRCRADPVLMTRANRPSARSHPPSSSDLPRELEMGDPRGRQQQIGASPNTWYAMYVPSALRAYRVLGVSTGASSPLALPTSKPGGESCLQSCPGAAMARTSADEARHDASVPGAPPPRRHREARRQLATRATACQQRDTRRTQACSDVLGL